jgi:hypothetical protein
MDKKIKGSWIIHHTNKLQKVDSQAQYENIFLAGKAGILLSAISATDQATIENDKLNVLAKAAKINTKTELPELLRTLKANELIDIGESGIDVLGITNHAVLDHVTNIYEKNQTTNPENAVIYLSEKASLKPENKDEISQELSDKYSLSTQEINLVLEDSESIGFVDVEKIDATQSIYFNGNLFRREEAQKINKVLLSLAAQEQQALVEFNTFLQNTACLNSEEAKRILGPGLYRKIAAIGLFDINIVSNNTEEVGFITRPSAFSKFSNAMIGDAFDLAKAFISSLTYGMTRSNYERGQIYMIESLLRALIAGRWVGPVNAIGEDYKILELKHVVEVQKFERKGRLGFNMRLLKKEIGELALQAILSGDVSEQSLTILPTATINKFIVPEETREKTRRKQIKESPKSTNDMLLVLRTGGGL